MQRQFVERRTGFPERHLDKDPPALAACRTEAHNRNKIAAYFKIQGCKWSNMIHWDQGDSYYFVNLVSSTGCKRLYPGMRAQHRAAVIIVGDGNDRRRPGRRARGDGSGDLRHKREIGVAKHEANIGVGNQLAAQQSTTCCRRSRMCKRCATPEHHRRRRRWVGTRRPQTCSTSLGASATPLAAAQGHRLWPFQ